MDGLIPMVYKSLKRNKTRRQYQCLSSNSAAAAASLTHTNYNIADFYMNQKDDHHHHHDYFSRKHGDQYVIPRGPDKLSGPPGAHHRRYNSAHVGFGLEEKDDDSAAAKPKQLVRFRSHRMFSCVTGVQG